MMKSIMVEKAGAKAHSGLLKVFREEKGCEMMEKTFKKENLIQGKILLIKGKKEKQKGR